MPPFFAYNFFVLLNDASTDSLYRSVASCEICALILCAFWASASSDLVDGFVREPRLCVYTNCKFKILHCLSSKKTQFLEQEGDFRVLERSSFFVLEDFIAAMTSLRSDWSVVSGLHWEPYSWDTAAHSIDAFESTL